MLATLETLPVVRSRSPLARTRQALGAQKLTVGFIGGSITADNGENWPDPVISWLQRTYPEARLVIENIAVGATGSDSGCLRVDREIIQRECDLCFVEYAVNDSTRSPRDRSRSREGLLRKLKAAGIDVVLVYTFAQSMYAEMSEGRVPDTIAEFETLAEHYQLNSVWMGLHALKEVCAGGLKWQHWLPDQLHPGPRGSWSYGEAVNGFLQSALITKEPIQAKNLASADLPAPLDPAHWQHTRDIELASIRTTGPWVLKRIHDYKHLDQVLETHAPGARLTFPFSGRGLVLIFEYGRISAEFRYRIDQGPWIVSERQRPDWAGTRGRVNPFTVNDDLPAGAHVFELEVIHGNRPECAGTECRLAAAFSLD